MQFWEFVKFVLFWGEVEAGLTNLYPFIPDNLLSDKVGDGELIGNNAAYVLEVAVGLVRSSSNIERAEKSAVGRPLIGRIDARPLAVTTIRRDGR